MALDEGTRGRDPRRPRLKPRPTRVALNDRVHHEQPERNRIRTFVGQALVNPNPDRDAEVRTLGRDGARALEEARLRLRRNFEATLVPRLEAANPRGERRIRERPGYEGEQAAGYVAVPGGLKPLYQSPKVPRQHTAPEVLADRAMEQLDPYVEQAAKYAGRPVRATRSVGRAFLPLTVAEKSLDPALVAFDVATLFPWIRGPKALGAGLGAARRGAAKPSAHAAKAFMEPTVVDEAVGRAVSKAAKRAKRVFRVGDHKVLIPGAGSRSGRLLESLVDSVMPEGMTQRRAGRETRYSIEHTMRLRNADLRELKRVGRKLSDEQEYALRVIAEGVAPEERAAKHIEWAAQGDELSAIYHGIHADLSERAGKYLVLGPDGRPVLRPDAPERLRRAWQLFEGAGETRETLLRDLGRLSDEQIAARIHAPRRVYAGARYRSFEAEVRRRLQAHPARDAYFAQLDAMLEPGRANAQKVLFDAAVRSAAERAGDPMAVNKILDHLADVRRSAGPPPGALLQADPILDAGTVEWAFRDYDDSILEEIATKYGLEPAALRAYAQENGERLTGRILSNREVWKEGHADYDAAREAASDRPVGGWIPMSGSNDPAGLYDIIPEDAQRLIRQARDEAWRKLAPPKPERPAALRRIPGESDDEYVSRQAAAEQDYLIRRQEWDAKYAQAPDTLPPEWLEQNVPMQGQTIRDGKPYFRWYLYETDGHRRVVWAHTPQEALEKGRRSSTTELTDRVEPAPAMGDEPRLSQRGGALDIVSPWGYKGAIEFTPDQQQAIIHLFSSADETTFVHELAHFIRRFGIDPKEEKRIAKWAGATMTNQEERRAARRAGQKLPEPVYEWTREAEERFARGVEQFVRTGRGPAGVKQAFNSLAPAFRDIYEHADLPDVPQHVAKFFERLFEYKPLRGGRLWGAEDVGPGVAYAPTWRGMPVKITEPHRAMGAYIRRTVSLFGGGRRRAVGAGPDDVHLRKSFTGSLLLSGFFRREVIGPKIESAILANRMAAVPEAHRAMLEAGSPIPRDVTDIAVKVDPQLETPDALKVFWDKIASVEGGQRKLGLRDLEDVNFELIEAVRGDIFPAQLEGRGTAEIAAEILETQAPIDNIVWVPQDFLDSTGLLHVPGSARAQRAGMSKALRRGIDASGLTWDALNDFQKALILYMNPAYVPMQLVGNMGMNLIQQGVFMPANLWRSVFLHREMSSLARVRIDEIMGVGAATALSMNTTPGQFIQATVGKWANVAADLVPRRAAFLHEARKAGYKKGAEIEALLEAARRGEPEAAQALEEITRLAKRAIVDFDRLSPFERNVIARWIFFYPWLRGATDWSIHFIADHPMQAMALALAADHVRAAQEEQLGDRPFYAQLDVPISTKTVGISVPGTDLGMGLDQLVGEHTWHGAQGNPMVLNLRQALTATTPLELGQIGIGFVTGGDREAAADLVQRLTPVPYAIGTSIYGYDPFIGKEVEPGLDTFFSDFGPGKSPLADRIRALNMSPEERAKKNERSIHPREYRHEWWRLFGGGLAPTPYSTKIGQRRALDRAPLLERRTFDLLEDSREAGLGEPPQAVIEDLKWATRVDEAIKRGDKWSERLEAVAEIYDERYPGQGMSRVVESVGTEAEARALYEQLRPLLYPLYAEWNRQLDRIIDTRLEAEPVG